MEVEKKKLRNLVESRLSEKVLPRGAYLSHLKEVYATSLIFRKASALVAFIPYRMEPEILPIMEKWLEAGKELWLPCYERELRVYCLAKVGGLDSNWLESGRWGILEPRADLPRVNPPYLFNDEDIWFIPGVAFSENGVRLGRGAGYYDRMLHGSRGIRIGITYEAAVLPDIPSAEHDEPVDYLLTETRFLKCVRADSSAKKKQEGQVYVADY